MNQSLMWTDHTEYEEYKKLQLSTVVRYQHNNCLIIAIKKKKTIEIHFFFNITLLKFQILK